MVNNDAPVKRNTLPAQYPTLVNEWDFDLNTSIPLEKVAPGSHKKAWWRCQKGHSYQSSIKSRALLGTGCPFCSNRKVLVGFNDLQTLMPHLAAEWDDEQNDKKATEVTVGSKYRAHWRCRSGHKWQTAISNRTNQNTGSTGCPYCSGKRVASGINDASVRFPELLQRWHPTLNANKSLSDFSSSSPEVVWWQCQEGHEYQSSIVNATRHSCPVCAGKIVVAGVNDLSTTHPQVANLWHPTKNTQVNIKEITAHSSKSVWWLCQKSHEFLAPVKDCTRSMSTRAQGCSVCAGQKVLNGYNDLATQRPDLTQEWAPENSKSPSEVTLSSTYLAQWKCRYGHVWDAVVSSRVRGNGCPVCTNKKVLIGFNDLSTTHPDLAREWSESNSITPEMVTAGSDTKVWWQCSQGHQWEAYVYTRTGNLPTGCPRCIAGLSSSQQENKLQKLLTHLGLKTETSLRTILGSKQELDIYLPDHNLAVEFNGLYWHSEAGGKDRDYHLNKTLEAKKVGVTLIHVWEDDWRDRQEIVLRGLAHRLGVTHKLREVLPDLPEYYTQTIGARQTKTITLDYNQSAEFLTKHHIQGKATGTHYLGLMDSKERLRAVLVLKRTGKTGELSIERYATAGTVSGGFSKLLKYAEKTYRPKRWVTFADLSISDGGLYEKTGFAAECVLRPDYSYLAHGKRVHKFNYRLKRFRDDPTLQYEEGMSESELAALNGLIRIWDTGKVRYVKEAS